MPAESVSKTLRRASPGVNGAPALKVALSTINSRACGQVKRKINNLYTVHLYAISVGYFIPKVREMTKRDCEDKNPSSL